MGGKAGEVTRISNESGGKRLHFAGHAWGSGA